MGNKKLNIVFLHPDLGIGGAERLVVDSALALQQKGHCIKIITAHHDPKHCFEETKNGTLEVIARGDFLPRHIFGKFHALFAYLRMIYIAIYLTIFSCLPADVVFCDQISACIPVLKLFQFKVLFYCHFPDQLLTDRKSALKKLYRLPLDWLEDFTTSLADLIVVNSIFTASIYKKTFHYSKKDPLVLYPSYSPTILSSESLSPQVEEIISDTSKDSKILLSLNRYERKKNVKLAIECFGLLKEKISNNVWQHVTLVIAGGYDIRVKENVEYLQELHNLSSELGIDEKVTFLISISNEDKIALLKKSTVLLYTPSNEHFGIVPLEAGYYETPVIAVDNGGPTETIVNEVTGYLCPSDANAFAEAVKNIICDINIGQTMGSKAKSRIISNFSFDNFSERLNTLIYNTMEND